MPAKQPSPSMKLDLSLLSNAVKAAKAQTKTKSKSKPWVANTSPLGSVTEQVQPCLDLEDVSAMKPTKKGKASALTPEQEATKTINEAIEKGIANAKEQVHRKLLTKMLEERIRQEINLKYHDKISPSDIDKFSRQAAYNASYQMNQIKVIPAEFIGLVPTNLSEDKPEAMTLEPDDNGDDF